MLSSRFAFLSLVLGVVGYVNASLLSSADSLTNVDPCIQPNPCDPTIVGNCPTNDAIDNVLTQHAPDVSVFWGGHYNNTTIREKAEDCAKLKNGLTIGMVLCKYNITMPAKPDDPLWQHASQTYAKQREQHLPQLGRVCLKQPRFSISNFLPSSGILKLGLLSQSMRGLRILKSCVTGTAAGRIAR